MGPQDILKNCKPSCNISGYTGKIRKLHNSNSDDYLHTKNSVKSIAIHYSLIQSAILTTEQEYYGSSNLIEIFGLISGYVAFFFGISLLKIFSKIINFTIKWTIRNIFTKQYDDHKSVEQTIIWFPRAHSFTQLSADSSQDINEGFAFGRCLDETFRRRMCSVKDLVIKLRREYSYLLLFSFGCIHQ